MEDSDKKVQMKVYIKPELLEKLKYLHKKQGPINFETNKRRPFSIFISNILSSHVWERFLIIDGLKNFTEKDQEEFEKDCEECKGMAPFGR